QSDANASWQLPPRQKLNASHVVVRSREAQGSLSARIRGQTPLMGLEIAHEPRLQTVTSPSHASPGSLNTTLVHFFDTSAQTRPNAQACEVPGQSAFSVSGRAHFSRMHVRVGRHSLPVVHDPLAAFLAAHDAPSQ